MDGRMVVTLGEGADGQLDRLATVGAVEPFRRGSSGPGGGSMVHVNVGRDAKTLVFTYTDGARRIDAIEVARPEGPTPSALRVTLDGVDVFATGALATLGRLESLGGIFDESEGGYSFTDAARSIGFWREGEPHGDDGLPVFFDAVLIASPGYYQAT